MSDNTVYSTDGAALVFLSPKADALPERDKTALLRAAARALLGEAKRRSAYGPSFSNSRPL